jgi:YjbE family integral membrane protein
MTFDILAAAVGIVFLNLILSGDNAVVIAMAARQLPDSQRKLAVIFGTAGAIVLRVGLTVVAAELLSVPLIEAVGGMLLVWIAWRLLKEDESCGTGHKQGDCLRDAVQIMIVADAAMSMDNVLAIAGAAHGNVPLLVFGLVLSMPIVMFVGTVLASVMNRLPWVAYVGAAVLAWVSAQMILDDHVIGPQIAHWWALQMGLPVLLAGLIFGAAWLPRWLRRPAEVQQEASITD